MRPTEGRARSALRNRVAVVTAIVSLGMTFVMGFSLGWLLCERWRGAEGAEEMEARLDVTTQYPSRLPASYHEAVRLYNLAEYGKTGDITEESACATNWTPAHARAQAALGMYLAQNGEDARDMAFLLMGELQRRKGDHRGSLHWYRRAMEDCTAYVRHHAGVNLVYAALRCKGTNEREALTVAKGLLADPALVTNTDVMVCAARAYRRAGWRAYEAREWGRARGFYQRALRLRPGWPDVATDLAATYLRLAEEAETGGEGKLALDYIHRADLLVNRTAFTQYRWPKIENVRREVVRLLRD